MQDIVLSGLTQSESDVVNLTLSIKRKDHILNKRLTDTRGKRERHA